MSPEETIAIAIITITVVGGIAALCLVSARFLAARAPEEQLP
ncbi:hypothetical protein [Humibacter ginsenosidimutans]|nr:hypothetical protein [Humibacter ginsenosidimutans]